MCYYLCMERSINYLKDRKGEIFSCGQITKQKLIPWALNYRTVIKIIKADVEGENILRAHIRNDLKVKRYIIKGNDLLKYLKKYGAVLMVTKRNYDKTINSKKSNI